MRRKLGRLAELLNFKLLQNEGENYVLLSKEDSDAVMEFMRQSPSRESHSSMNRPVVVDFRVQ